MGGSFPFSSSSILSLAATYWLHSTLLIGGAWCFLRVFTGCSHALRERLWKFSAVAAFVTTGRQTTIGLGIPLLPALPDSRAELYAKASPFRPAEDSSGLANSLRSPATVGQSLILVEQSLERLQQSVSTMQQSDAQPDLVAALTSAAAEGDLELSQTEITVGDVSDNIDEAVKADSGKRNSWIASSTQETSPSTVTGGLWEDCLQHAAFVFVGAVGIGAVGFVGQWLMFVLATRELKPADEQGRQTLDQLLARMKIERHVDLLVSSRIPEPVAFGAWRWKIVLPENLEQRLTCDELASLLAHEVAHLARGDVFWLHVGRLLTTVFAWQPLNFLARRKWQVESEFLCDDWATRRSIDSVVLARCLTQVAEWRSERSPGVIALPIGGQRGHLTERVERLLKTTGGECRPRRFKRIVQSLVLCTACGTLALSGPSVRPAESFMAEAVSGEDRTAETAVTDQGEITDVTAPETSRVNVRKEVLAELDQASAELALEVALLSEELAALGPLLEQESDDSEIAAVARRLLKRIARLSEASNVQRKNQTGEESDAEE